MNRCLALLGALLLTFITVSSACTAAPGFGVHFSLEPHDGNPDKIQASFRQNVGGPDQNNWSDGFRPSDLVGLNLAAFRGAGSHPLSFAIVHEAGRLDCSGHGGDSFAVGTCSFTADPGFTQLLQARGIGRPTDEQQFGLMAVNARREMIDAVAAANYPTPSIDDLMSLAALGVNGAYISEMARAGYRPKTIDTLIQFKALNITPEWIRQFVNIGYGNLPGDELVELKALNITPEFIAGFDRVGYRHLPIDELVQLKALNITPEFVQRIEAVDGTKPTVDKLVQIKSFGKDH